MEFLREHQVLTLAVAGPYAAALFYVVDDALNFYVVSDPKTRHGAAMLTASRVAGTIQRDRQQWETTRGVQFTGRCVRLTGAAYVAGWKVYRRRFAFLGDVSLPGLGQLAKALAKTDLWKIEPDWMRLIDNGVKFGHKIEWSKP